MRHVDYIIVGCGLASVAFCEILKAENKSFVVFDDASQKSSIVAAGLYNPVILKRFTKVWQSKEQLHLVNSMYPKLEKELGIKVDHKLKILRRFASIEEQNLWFEAQSKPELETYMSPDIIKTSLPCIDAPFHFGEVLHAGRIDTKTLLMAYKERLKSKHHLLEEQFQYDAMTHSEEGVVYKDIKAKHAVFAEGFGVKRNPYFKDIKLNGNKGEVLTIEAPDLHLNVAIKSSVFLLPIGQYRYYVGATYNREDKSQEPTLKAKEELLRKLRSILKCDFKVVNHVAGIRPTTVDRRPLVGRHSKHKNLYVLNGLGTRGVMIGPYVSQQLFQLIEYDEPLDMEINFQRF
ncbi:FAD-binding oxidoreductase [Winogradskyella maritima]|uniref:NAD(P)/FAD-dependent oxidoreductase n=1 Tax=Winogradskyella maritima TaxID=1517766 RepID=A0ABV8AH03_9FLAO|nr:FAD-binding oxidoreductase [Winogradskyella maritima]